MSYFPAFLDLDGRPCLLVGAGQTAARKLRRLLKTGARVTVVSPEVDPEIEALAAARRSHLASPPFPGRGRDRPDRCAERHRAGGRGSVGL